MIRRPMPQVPAFLAAALLAVPMLLHDARPAQADTRIRVRADVRARGSVRVVPRAHHRRTRHLLRHRRYATSPSRVRLHVDGGVYWSGGIYVGPRFAEPPPPPSCDCAPPPAHAPYDRPAPPPTVVAAPAPAPALPRLGIGVFAGSVGVDNRMRGDDLGLLGRVRLTDSLLIEGEVARTEMEDGRVDRRLGGALLYDFAPRSRLSLHVLGGAGVTGAESDAWQPQQSYGELGLGLTYRATSRLHLAADLRGGASGRIDAASASDEMKYSSPSAGEEERFSRGRLSAFLYF